MNKKVIIGLSGGVDSAVSAYLLKQQGYDVEAVFMNNWDSIINNENVGNNDELGCSNKQDLIDATNVANFLNIKLHVINFIEEYWNQVFLKFLKKYESGATPNPDVLCNKYIKFEAFREYVFNNFNAQYFALGHYANIQKNQDNSFDLTIAKDAHKDQTYFLCELNQKQIEKVIFPIGNYLKKEVRNIAKEIKLPIWNKKDSVGICFIGKRNFQDFISNYIPVKKGKIIDIETNEIVGEHPFLAYLTIGQTKNLNLFKTHVKYYVCKKDVKQNIIYVSSDLNKLEKIQAIEIDNFNWINKTVFEKPIKIRYRHCGQLFDAKIIKKEKITIVFDQPQKLIAIGQYAVCYDENICLGGGEITKIV